MTGGAGPCALGSMDDGSLPMSVAKDGNHYSLIWRYIVGAALAWTAIIGGSLLWNLHLLDEQAMALARKEAVANFNKDQGFRLWGTRHGGVYVPVPPDTPPSPYLAHIPERDIETPSGRALTLLNPAYMVRQMMENDNDLYGIRGKITGLVVLRPGNAPDDWERAALHQLKAGAEEVSEINDIDGVSYLRMMRPMHMKPGCEKCHGHLGFKLGDFRGGVGVSVPIRPYIETKWDSAQVFIFSHALIWVLGLGGIGIGFRQVSGRMAERDRAEADAKAHQNRLEHILDIAPEAVIALDGDMNISLFNQGAERIFGYSTEEIIGRPLDTLIPGPSRQAHRRLAKGFARSTNILYFSLIPSSRGFADTRIFPVGGMSSPFRWL